MSEFFVSEIREHVLVRRGIYRDVLLTPGIDWGRPLEIIHKNENYLVITRRGHGCFGGIGRRDYARTFYALLRLDPQKDGFSARIIIRREPDKLWQAAKKELIQKADEMAGNL